MTSLIAAGGSGRSTSVIPAVPAASSVTTIAFIPHSSRYRVLAFLHRRQSGSHADMTPKRDHPSMQRARDRIEAEGAVATGRRGRPQPGDCSVRSVRWARWSTGPRCGLTDEFPRRVGLDAEYRLTGG